MSVLCITYRRLSTKLSNGEYAHDGAIDIMGSTVVFKDASFKHIIEALYTALTSNESVDRVILQRTDRPGIAPIELGSTLVQLLRTDPLSAYRAMNFNAIPAISTGGSSVGADFSRHVYVRIQDGRVEDPLTGTWRPLAYGSKQGWKVRAENNNSSTWLPLVALVDDAPSGAGSIERIAFATWAIVDVEELLKTNAREFYLPRVWNTNGPWILREELQALYEESKEKVS